MNSDEISNLIVEKEKAKLEAQDNLDLAEQRLDELDDACERLKLERDSLAVKIQAAHMERKKHSKFVRMGKRNLSRLVTEISILNRQFWQAKNG